MLYNHIKGSVPSKILLRVESFGENIGSEETKNEQLYICILYLYSTYIYYMVDY